MAANFSVSALIALPILPVSVVGGSFVAAVNPDVRETIVWPEFVDQVATKVETIPIDERAGAVVLTANYGEAGARERWGPSLGLPAVYSAHNSYADFAVPPGSTGPVVIIGYNNPTDLFIGCSRKATLQSRFDLDNEENGKAV